MAGDELGLNVVEIEHATLGREPVGQRSHLEILHLK
jgi:hypothetical protein